MRTVHLLLVGVLAGTGLSASARAQADAATAPDAELSLDGRQEWRAEFYAWIWAMGLDGDIGVRGLNASVSASFVDVVEASDSILAFSGRLEIGYGRFGGFVDGMYADLGVEDASGPGGLANIDIEFRQTLVDFGLMYRVLDRTPTGRGEANRRNLTLDLYAGGRYSGLELELMPAMLPTRSGSKSWVDPIVGAKVVVPFAERWRLELNGDIGGFGAASDFTWSTTAVVGFDFRMFDLPASVLAGYRAIGWDYSDGSGANRFTWDLIQHGLILGLSIQF